MNRRRIGNILRKEWHVMSRDINSVLLVTLAPLLIVGQAILLIWLIDRFGVEAIEQIIDRLLREAGNLC